MDTKRFEFGMPDVVAMANFIAQLTRLGVTYKVVQLAGGWAIELTEGFTLENETEIFI